MRDRSETRFRYHYDSQGNWVAKTIESRSRTEDEFTLSAVEQARHYVFRLANRGVLPRSPESARPGFSSGELRMHYIVMAASGKQQRGTFPVSLVHEHERAVDQISRLADDLIAGWKTIDIFSDNNYNAVNIKRTVALVGIGPLPLLSMPFGNLIEGLNLSESRMRKSLLAERFLSKFTHPDRAIAITGDLLEESRTRGVSWFWIQVIRTMLSLLYHAMLSMPIRTIALIITGILLLFIGIPFVIISLRRIVDSQLIIGMIGWHPGLNYWWKKWLVTFVCGRLLSPFSSDS